MTDIVEQVRKADKFSGLDVGHYWNLCEEAADEINKLRRERDEERARTAEARKCAEDYRERFLDAEYGSVAFRSRHRYVLPWEKP